MLPTIGLLSRDSQQALIDIILHHNPGVLDTWNFNTRTVMFGAPQVVSGRRTRIAVAARPSTPYDDAKLANSFNFTYNRLNLVEVFFQHVGLGMDMELPISTDKVLEHLKTFLPFVHDSDEFVQRTIYEGATSFVLEANPNSLRWQGSITIPLHVITSLDEIIHTDYLHGLDDVELMTVLDVLITRRFLHGLRYAELADHLLEMLPVSFLHGLNNIPGGLMTTIDAMVAANVLPGHWVWNNDRTDRVIVSNTGHTGETALRTLVSNNTVVPVDFTMTGIAPAVPGWAARGRVDVTARLFTGTRTLYYEKIDIAWLPLGGSVTVEEMIDPAASLAEINGLLGTDIAMDEVEFIIDPDDEALWYMHFGDDHPLFYGVLPINDSSVGPKLFVQGLVPIAETGYYKFNETVSYTRGPATYNTPLRHDDLTDYRCFWDSGSFIIQKYDINTWNTVQTVAYINTPYHVSLGFDQNGAPIIAWEYDDDIYIYWYDISQSSQVITNLGTGRSPMVSISSLNEVVSLQRQVYLLYVDGRNLCYRAQNDRYTVRYVLDSSVEDIVSIGHTVFNSLKVEYVVLDGTEYVVRNMATDRSAVWVSEPPVTSETTAQITNIQVRNVVTRMSDLLHERPLSGTVTALSGTMDIVPSLVSMGGLHERPLSGGVTILGGSLEIRDHVIRQYIEEPVPPALTHTLETGSLSIWDSYIEETSEGPVPQPLTHSMQPLGLVFNYSKAALLVLIERANLLVANEWTPLTYQPAVEKRIAAQTVYDNASAAQVEINVAWNDLFNALNNLEPAGDGGDPYGNYVRFYMPMDGPDNSTFISDERDNVWTTVGDAKIRSGSSVYGTGGLLLANGGHITAGAINLANGVDECTLEMVIKITADTGVTGTLLSSGVSWSAGALHIHLEDGELACYVNGLADNLSGGGVLPLDTPVHIAIELWDGDVRTYIDGVLSHTVPVDSNHLFNFNHGDVTRIGAGYTPIDDDLNGVVDDVKLTLRAKYRGNDYIPAAGISTVGRVADPYWSDVVSYLEFNGDLGSVDIIDNRDLAVWTVHGGAYIDTQLTFRGQQTLRLDGDTDYLTRTLPVPVDNDELTMEAWIYCTDTSLYNGILYIGDVNSNEHRRGLNITAGLGVLNFWVQQGTGTGVSCQSVNPVPMNQWVHVAATRKDGVNRVFINGVLENTVDLPYVDPFLNGDQLAIGVGRSSSTAKGFHGAIAYPRVTSGVAKYTGAFAVPVAAHPDDDVDDPHFDNVLLLMHFDGNGDDATGGVMQAHTLDPAYLGDGPFGPAARFVDNQNHGYVSNARGAGASLSDNNFTIEFMARFPEATASTRCIVAQNRVTAGYPLSWSLNITTSSIRFVHYPLGTGGSSVSASVNWADHWVPNKWHHIALTRDVSTGLLHHYVDGVLVGTVDSVPNSLYYDLDTSYFHVGKLGYPGYQYPFIGDIAELRITRHVVRYNPDFKPPIYEKTPDVNLIGFGDDTYVSPDDDDADIQFDE